MHYIMWCECILDPHDYGNGLLSDVNQWSFSDVKKCEGK